MEHAPACTIGQVLLLVFNKTNNYYTTVYAYLILWVKFSLKNKQIFSWVFIFVGVNFCGRTPYFVLKDAIKYYARVCILKLTFQWFLAPSMPPKRDVSTQNLP